MPAPDPVETILARLMPPALSHGCQSELDAMLAELADGGSAPAPRPEPRRRRWHSSLVGLLGMGTGIAATLSAMLWIESGGSSNSPLVAAMESPPADQQASGGILLVSETKRVEAIAEEGWHEDSEGTAMRALRVNVVDEEDLLDQETGIVMQVSRPREELFLMPVSTF